MSLESLAAPCRHPFPWCTCEGDPLSLGAAASLTESVCLVPARDPLGGRWNTQRGPGGEFKTVLGHG